SPLWKFPRDPDAVWGVHIDTSGLFHHHKVNAIASGGPLDEGPGKRFPFPG
ncbi:hypothetical protein JTE90_016551, partial [Oedothorax gibbosus]